MIFNSLFSRKPRIAERVYERIVAAARQPDFYAQLNVPDTVEGRFDMIALHMFLVLNRLKDEPDKQMAQELVDTFFADMDRSLREMGVGDLTVGKKVRKIAESFYGRVDAYRKGLGKDDNSLVEALGRNVFADADKQHVEILAAWVRSACLKLSDQDVDRIAAGEIVFPDVA